MPAIRLYRVEHRRAGERRRLFVIADDAARAIAKAEQRLCDSGGWVADDSPVELNESELRAELGYGRDVESVLSRRDRAIHLASKGAEQAAQRRVADALKRSLFRETVFGGNV